jgi:hypothetical protein
LTIGTDPAWKEIMTRPESYWIERNTLVDAVHAASAGCRKRTDGCGLDSTDTNYGAYLLALDTLKAFDLAHGGAPVL